MNADRHQARFDNRRHRARFGGPGGTYTAAAAPTMDDATATMDDTDWTMEGAAA